MPTPAAPAVTIEVRLTIRGMSCATCAGRVERALGAAPGVTDVNVNLVNEEARLRIVPGTTLDGLCEVVTRAGYRPSVVPSGIGTLRQSHNDEASRTTAHHDGWLALGALGLSLPLVVPMMAMPFGVHVHWPRYVEFLLAAAVQFGFGARFYRGAYLALCHRTGNMDSLVVMGTTAAFTYSLWLWLGGGHGSAGPHESYFEASAMVIALVRVGKWLQSRAKFQTSSALRELARLFPAQVAVRQHDGERWIPIEDLAVGMVFLVRPGERVASDGVVIEGRSAVDESLVSGESAECDKQVGSEVVGGSKNTTGTLLVQVTRVGSESTLGRIIEYTERAQASRARVEHLVDRVSGIFVPSVAVIALLTFVAWWGFGGNWETALMNAVSVLVVACPCALGLATPTAVVAGTGVAARLGIVVRDVETLERAATIDVVVFDKTGTLTEGRPAVVGVVSVVGTENELLAMAASLQQSSEHPLACAMVRAAEERSLALQSVEDFRSHPGSGVEGVVAGRRVRVGSPRWLAESGVESPELDQLPPRLSAEGTTVSAVAVDRAFWGWIGQADALRPKARAAVDVLRAAGKKIVVLSGDEPRTVAHFADALGVDEAVGRARPQDKLDFIATLQGQGKKVVMVGDGINDAPALAAADLGIAMGEGTDVAIETARIVLMRPDPVLVSVAMEIAGATFAKIRQNLFWAFFYNSLCIPLAAAGWLSPMLAGAAMAFSSISVVANSLRLLRWRPRRVLVACAANCP